MKKVLITGASRGIGEAIAREFAANGYHVFLTCAHSRDMLFKLRDLLEREYKIPCDAFLCDMGDYAAVEQLFAKLPDLDVLINNAGISYFGLLSDMSVEDWHRILNVNLNACFYTCKLAIPSMVRKQKGRILNISSVWGNSGASMETAYSAAKGGMNALTKALAKELAPSNIQVNALAPGVIDTAMNSHLSDEDMEALRAEIPSDRLGTPAEVARLAWQVVNAPGYMTGQIIGIDGGFN